MKQEWINGFVASYRVHGIHRGILILYMFDIFHNKSWKILKLEKKR